MLNLLFAVLCLSSLVLSQPQPLDLTQFYGKTALFISAPPDDIEGLVGGTVKLLTEQKTNVFYVIVTNGDKGCANPSCVNLTAPQLAAIRQQEAYNAAAVLGVPQENLILLDYEDSQVTSYPYSQILMDIIASIRSIKPNVVMSWFPYPQLDLRPSQYGDLGFHPDHQAVGRFTLEAQFESQLPLLYPEIGEAWSVSQFYMWAINKQITHYVDISSTLPFKIDAFLQHKSQYSDPNHITQSITGLASNVANFTGVQGLTYAEAFTAYF